MFSGLYYVHLLVAGNVARVVLFHVFFQAQIFRRLMTQISNPNEQMEILGMTIVINTDDRNFSRFICDLIASHIAPHMY